ncbi:NAD(P)H-quinone oxidoreductase subunit I, chloroplastic [subsurface metagenome]
MKIWRVHTISYEFDGEKCTCGIGLCVEACAQGSLELNEETKKMEMINLEQCIFCRQCEDVCPTQAISIKGALTLQDVTGIREV